MYFFNILIVLIFGLLPGFIWLIYYLRKDPHPEPKRIIIKLFLIGFAITPLAAIIELYSQYLLEGIVKNIIMVIIGGAVLEETLKYLSAKHIINRNKKDFNEAPDAMIYLIVVALGFATAENIIILLGSYLNGETINGIITISVMRFWGATLLHTLASGILGYYLAFGYKYNKTGEIQNIISHVYRYKLIKGLFFAIIIHIIFNYLIIAYQDIQKIEYKYWYLSFIIILLIMGLIIAHREFKRLYLK